jgi:hypothetical protein
MARSRQIGAVERNGLNPFPRLFMIVGYVSAGMSPKAE